MINALILEKFTVKNRYTHSNINFVRECKDGHLDLKERNKINIKHEWEYPRKILNGSDKSEKLFYWSDSECKLCYVENDYFKKGYIYELTSNKQSRTNSIIKMIKPISWYETYFSKFGRCTMFISQDGELYFVNDNENQRVITEKIKTVVNLIPLKEGVIVVGYDRIETGKMINMAILSHPLEHPTEIALKSTSDSSDKSNELNFKVVIWGSVEFPLIMVYDQVERNHSIYVYSYFNHISSLVIEFIWEDPSKEYLECAKSIFISRNIFDGNIMISYHIPSISELKLLIFSECKFNDVCHGEKSIIENRGLTLQAIKNVKDVVPITFGYQQEKHELFGINYLYGFSFAESDQLFKQDKSQDLPVFSLILLNTGMLLLYSGSEFILNVEIKDEKLENFELLGISSGISNNFDALLKFDGDSYNEGHLMGVRCSIKLLPDDFLVQILTKLLLKITNPEFSISIIREILLNKSNDHWDILCRVLLGEIKDFSTERDLKSSNKSSNCSIESPMSNGVYKKIKLFSDGSCSNNKSKTWQILAKFWANYLEKNCKSPFDRIEFSNLISKGIIPYEFLQGKKHHANYSNNGYQHLQFKATSQCMYFLHALYEELSLFPQFNALDNYQNRLMMDILIPLSKKLCLPNYYEYYQFLNSSFNFIGEIKVDLNYSDWDFPPILLDRLYFITKFSKNNKQDIYLKSINKHFPLQYFTIKLYEQLLNGSKNREIIDFISKVGITNTILPILSPIISFPIEKFLNAYSNNVPNLSYDDSKYFLLGRLDMLNSAKKISSSYSNINFKKITSSSESIAAAVLPHGRNTVDDQKSMLENLQIYYKNKVDPFSITSAEKRTIIEIWKNDLTEYSDIGSFELSYKWCFQVFSYDNRYCDALELLSLKNPPSILLQRSSGAYPIDEESWDEFQRQRIVDAIQLVYTSLLGRAACTFGGSSFDISLNKLKRPIFVNKVYEVASNSLISVDIERFKEVCFEISVWNEFYMGVTQSLNYYCPNSKFLEDSFDKNKKLWIIEQIDAFSSQEDTPFISGFLYGISLSGFLKLDKSDSITNFPLILEPKDIYKILKNDGQSIKTCSILLATAISALKSQNTTLLRLYLMHIPSILPSIYTKSLQISSINQYSAITSIGLLFSQSRSRQVIEILFSEFLRAFSDIDDQASTNPNIYSISVAISLGMVLQPSEESNDISCNTMIEDGITNTLLSCISGNKLPKFFSNLASGPNLEHYTEFSGLKRFKYQNENMDGGNMLKSNTSSTSDTSKFSNSSKNYCSKIVDSTILAIPAAISLSIMHIRSKNKSISSSITIPFNRPEELVNYRPEVLIFMSFAKIIIEWEESCIPNKDFICSQIPSYLWYLPSDKIFPFPITSDKYSEAEPQVNAKLMHCISMGTLDWIHCIQARIAILSGIIWGLGIMFAGKRNTEVKYIITTILEYLDRIPLIQMPLSIASTIRDKSICSTHITIDRWSRELCIRVCLTSVSVCFSGSGDRQILMQIKYFRAQLLESAQLLWTSSTAISPFSIFSIPPIEHVHSQLMAYNNALGFLFLSAGHYSFSNKDKLGSTFLLLATYPIYPKDCSDISTPGIIFQPLRYLFISAINYGRRVVIPKLVACSPEPLNNSCNFSGVISEEKIYVPISVELKSESVHFQSRTEYYILPTILPDWEEIINVKVLGDTYCPISIDFKNDKDTSCYQRFINGQLWVQTRNRNNGYCWNEANHIINHVKSYQYPKVKLYNFSDNQLNNRQMLYKYYETNNKNLGANSNVFNQCDEISELYKDFSHTLVLEENEPFYCKMFNKEIPNRKVGCVPWRGTILNNYIDKILSTWDKINQDGSGCEILLSSEIIKILRIMLNIDDDKRLQTILLNIHRRLQAQMSVLIRCVRYYYSAHNGTRIPSCDEKQSLRLFLSLNGMPLASHFNYIIKKKIESNKKIDTLLRKDYKKYEEIITPILILELPTLSSLGIQILKVFIHEHYIKTQNLCLQPTEAQQQIKTILTRIFSSKNYF
ncbi:Cut4 Apc1p TSG24 family meiotic check point regulator and 26S proteasome regulatory complex PC-rep repeats [Cryptosporidium sp. chipmunk genotype I]|uniref:Cut4 Apc1p TSG24 family meiotic check point regulator and 26S proteasome regulatory complex PC-rep repeats n=1 Tax=Cryptosporidium sp. chipmunk genotype I TaxID=1280935 RepID=UPI003519E572|nr:Cut4 Apc1p TSG24 family meiotic check point regulator and 26S proteasome regulatory complex PC-rep repeats [Cryptosporidium sp. chipmunk genotype I]